MIGARSKGMFRSKNLLHLRCEISDPTTETLVDPFMRLPQVRLASLMDHTPVDRQSPNIDRWFKHMIRDMEVSEAEGHAAMDHLFERSKTHGAEVAPMWSKRPGLGAFR
ncbi:hypothetical protein V8J82_13320 [Gymnodinialimonas sp. 2305UL16-5]|uniref:hypothetical protein n=1 Tax=Gymnodinialimonas mytili TaxID=3126503 RepID=UPI00309BEC6A